MRVGTENAQDNTALGASVSLQNLIIETAGTGPWVSLSTSRRRAAVHRLSMSGTTVRTRGDDSFALQLSGFAGATLYGVALETAGQQARGGAVARRTVERTGAGGSGQRAGVSAIHAQDAGSFTLSGSILPPGARKSPGRCAGRHAGDVDGYAGHDAGRYRARLAGGGRGYARQRRRVVDLRREFAAAWLLAGGSAQFRDTVLSTVGEASHGVDVAAHSEVELAHAGGPAAKGLMAWW